MVYQRSNLEAPGKLMRIKINFMPLNYKASASNWFAHLGILVMVVDPSTAKVRNPKKEQPKQKESQSEQTPKKHSDGQRDWQECRKKEGAAGSL